MTAFYNENDPKAAHVLRTLIEDSVIAPGVVDTRSITEIQPHDIAPFTQVHLFAGGGLWSVAARLAGWPDDRPILSASCPCQPFSVAGKGAGTSDERHLWPHVHRLINGTGLIGKRFDLTVGEQVAGAAGYNWFNGVRADLEAEGYRVGVVDTPACAVDAPHIRQRLYWIATANERRLGVTLGDAERTRLEGQRRDGDGATGRQVKSRSVATTDDCLHADTDSGRRAGWQESAFRGEGRRAAVEWDLPRHNSAYANGDGWGAGRRNDEAARYGSSAPTTHGRNGTYWSDAIWIDCHDGKSRRAKSGLRVLADGFPGELDQVSNAGALDYALMVPRFKGRIPLWKITGNAIVPELAAEVIRAFLDAEREGLAP